MTLDPHPRKSDQPLVDAAMGKILTEPTWREMFTSVQKQEVPLINTLKYICILKNFNQVSKEWLFFFLLLISGLFCLKTDWYEGKKVPLKHRCRTTGKQKQRWAPVFKDNRLLWNISHCRS